MPRRPARTQLPTRIAPAGEARPAEIRRRGDRRIPPPGDAGWAALVRSCRQASRTEGGRQWTSRGKAPSAGARCSRWCSGRCGAAVIRTPQGPPGSWRHSGRRRVGRRHRRRLTRRRYHAHYDDRQAAILPPPGPSWACGGVRHGLAGDSQANSPGRGASSRTDSPNQGVRHGVPNHHPQPGPARRRPGRPRPHRPRPGRPRHPAAGRRRRGPARRRLGQPGTLASGAPRGPGRGELRPAPHPGRRGQPRRALHPLRGQAPPAAQPLHGDGPGRPACPGRRPRRRRPPGLPGGGVPARCHRPAARADAPPAGPVAHHPPAARPRRPPGDGPAAGRGPDAGPAPP
jgi:hypothetical protein